MWKKFVKSGGLVMIIWPAVLWFVTYEISLQVDDILHHPLEFIIPFFIINALGVGAFLSSTGKLEEDPNERLTRKEY
jgi:hypothetical protein